MAKSSPSSAKKANSKEKKKGAAPAPAPPAASGAVDEKKLRDQLLPIFFKFDIDKSGAISTKEMGSVCKEMGVTLTDEDLTAMMKDADPDNSGEVHSKQQNHLARPLSRYPSCLCLISRYHRSTLMNS